MDRFTAKQNQISRQQADFIRRYPALWRRIVSESSQPQGEDRAWLMYSANYLFRTHQILWAMDPLRLQQRLPQAPALELASGLEKISFVLLTHAHEDHLDLDLIHSLRAAPILWVVPRFLLQPVRDVAGLSPQRMIIPAPMRSFEIQNIRVTAFEGLHRDLPAMGYLVEFNGKRWLFPGDTRVYEARQLPDFGPLDGLFAHLWLGRRCALEDALPYIDDLCRFCAELQPRRVILTHLCEFGRDADDYWDEEHVIRLQAAFKDRSPEIPLIAVYPGESVSL